jgi:hypothetical protein
MKLTRPVLVAVAAAVLTAVPAAAASAQTVLHRDATHDVRSVDEASTSNASTREPRVPQGDISVIAITHARRLVTVSVKFRDLDKSAPWLHEFSFRTDTGKRREVDLFAGPGSWSGQQTFGTSTGTKVPCSGLRHTIDYVKHKVTLTVPRSCLGKPRWVQVAEGTVRFGDSDPSSSKAYADDAFSLYVGNNLHWSPKVHRG